MRSQVLLVLEHQCQLCLPLSSLGSDLKVNVFVLKHILKVNFVKEKLLKTNRAYITKLYLAHSIAIVNVAWVDRERVVGLSALSLAKASTLQLTNTMLRAVLICT